MQRVGTFSGKRFVIFLLIPILLHAFLIALDYFTKYFAQKDAVSVTVIEDFFYLSFTLNSGAAFSFLADKPWGQTVFMILTPIALVAFVAFYVFAVKKKYKWLAYSLVLVVSGTVGNYIDRIMSGKVVDFLQFKFGSYYFPTFNVADICLTVGVIMLIVHFCFFDDNAIFKKRVNGGANTDVKTRESDEIK